MQGKFAGDLRWAVEIDVVCSANLTGEHRVENGFFEIFLDSRFRRVAGVGKGIGVGKKEAFFFSFPGISILILPIAFFLVLF